MEKDIKSRLSSDVSPYIYFMVYLHVGIGLCVCVCVCVINSVKELGFNSRHCDYNTSLISVVWSKCVQNICLFLFVSNCVQFSFCRVIND